MDLNMCIAMGPKLFLLFGIVPVESELLMWLCGVKHPEGIVFTVVLVNR